jgi:hypothetical protein
MNDCPLKSELQNLPAGYSPKSRFEIFLDDDETQTNLVGQFPNPLLKLLKITDTLNLLGFFYWNMNKQT